MKKIIIILMMLFTSLIFIVTYQHESNKQANQILKLASLDISDVINCNETTLEIPIEDKVKHLKLIEYLNNYDEIIVMTGYTKQLNDNKNVTTIYLKDNNEKIINYLQDQFIIEGSNDYLSTNPDNQEATIIKTINNSYFNLEYQFKPLTNQIVDYDGINNSLVYKIYYLNDDLNNPIINDITNLYMQDLVVATTNHESEISDYNFDYIILIIVTLIGIIILTISYMINNIHEFSIVWLLGYNYQSIIKNYFISFLITIVISSSLTYLILFIIIIRNFNKLACNLNQQIMIIHLILFIIMIMIFISGFAFIYHKNLIEYLKQKNHWLILSKICFILKNILTIALFLVLVITINTVLPQINLGISLYHQKEFFSQMYKIDNIKDDCNYTELLLPLDGVVACNFYNSVFYDNTTLPTIIVNNNYLKNYPIVTTNNQILIDFNTGDILIPEKYRKETHKLPKGNYYFIQNNNCFYDPTTISKNGKCIDPVIIIDNDSSITIYAGAELFLPNSQPISYYRQLLNLKTKDVQITQAIGKYNYVLSTIVKPQLLKYSLYACLFIIVTYLIDVTTLLINTKAREKEIFIKMFLGYSYFKIYAFDFILNFIVYFLPVVFSIYYLKINMIIIIWVLFFLFTFENILITTNIFKSIKKIQANYCGGNYEQNHS